MHRRSGRRPVATGAAARRCPHALFTHRRPSRSRRRSCSARSSASASIRHRSMDRARRLSSMPSDRPSRPMVSVARARSSSSASSWRPRPSAMPDHPQLVLHCPALRRRLRVLFDLVVNAVDLRRLSWMEACGCGVGGEPGRFAGSRTSPGSRPIAGGVFVTGGTARQPCSPGGGASPSGQQRSTRPHRWYVLYRKVRTARSLPHGARMDVDIHDVRTDATGHMRADGIAAALEELQGAASASPTNDDGPNGAVFALVATGGTTNAGIVDDLVAAADAAATHSVWLHRRRRLRRCSALRRAHVHASTASSEPTASWSIRTSGCSFHDCPAVRVLRTRARTTRARNTPATLEILHHDAEWNPSDYALPPGTPWPAVLVLTGHARDRRHQHDAVEASLALTVEVAAEIERRHALELVSATRALRRAVPSPRLVACPVQREWSERMLTSSAPSPCRRP